MSAESGRSAAGSQELETIVTRLASVRERIARCAREAGRDASEILLVGVTKTFPSGLARAALEAGLTDLGENRVQELILKHDALPDARWHLVGRLQRNKIRHVVGRAVLVHSVDREDLARDLAARASRYGTVQHALVQVNVGDDPAKGGCEVDRTAELVAYARDLEGLQIDGLMTVPPLPDPGADPVTDARRHFAVLRELRDVIRPRYPEIRELSMGMSADLEAAVAEGATIVRVGTDIFGARPVGTDPTKGMR